MAMASRPNGRSSDLLPRLLLSRKTRFCSSAECRVVQCGNPHPTINMRDRLGCSWEYLGQRAASGNRIGVAKRGNDDG